MIFRNFFSNTHVRSAKAIKNIISSFIIKGVSIAINLALVPLTINYLNPTKYGVWLTISSMVTWISFFDIGLGNGLRNKLTEAISQNDIVKAKSYVSTAYFSISILCCVLFAVFIVINQFLNWNTLLNIPVEVDENLKTLMLILFSMFSIQFILQLINSIFLSNQMSAKVSFYNMLSNLLILIVISLLVKFTNESLFNIAFVFSLIPVMVLAGINFYYFKNNFNGYAPNLKSFDVSVLKDVLSLGFKFFIIQVSVLIFYQTTNFLISRYFSPELVTPYNIAFRYFGIITMIFSIFVSPYWSAITEAYVKQDFIWIKKSVKQLFLMWIVLVVISIVMLLFSNYAYRLWIGDKIEVDFKLSLFMMLYTILMSFGNIFIVVLNGIGKIRLQMIVNIIGMIVFIPMSYYLAVVLKLEVVGIIISTIVCSLYGPLIAPLQVKRLLDKRITNIAKV